MFLFLLIYFYLFLAVLGLCCCTWAFSSCSKWGLLFAAVRGLLIVEASLVVEHGLRARGLQQLRLAGLVAPRHVGSSRTRARTHVPCVGRWILNHCTTREALHICFFIHISVVCITIKIFDSMLRASKYLYTLVQ